MFNSIRKITSKYTGLLIRMDDISEKNLIRIKALADDWWKKFGKRSINFINS